MGARITVIALGKVAVEGRDDGVLAVRVIDVTRPLSDAGTAGIGEDHAANFFELGDEAIALDGVANLLTTGCDGEFGVRLQSLGDRIFDDRSRTADVFVG